MARQVDEPDYHSENHTAVQTCGWTKNALRGEGTCYKYAFYGIRSHRCIQMTPVVRCNERCVFCWRDHAGHAFELDDVAWDDPEAVADASIELQRKLLAGFGGNDDVPEERFEESMDPQHVAISLDGEPTLYPYLPALIEEFHDRGLTTFLVSNGTRPDVLADVDPTQLYLSLDAPTEDVFEDVVAPVEDAAWEDLLRSLDVLAETDARTTIRTTLVAGENANDPGRYAELIQRARPDFVELKGYMHVGHSRDRLDRSAMPDHGDVAAFADRLQAHLPALDVRREAEPSNVVMLAREEDTWIEGLEPADAE
ncbi:MAG: 4-demethylwyosine synthase TYW1 [Halanaeroarchaeum sp.]